MTAQVIQRAELPGESSRAFQGYLHGGVGVCFYWTDAPPGAGPRLHTHPYEEVFIIQEGQATFTVGDEQVGAEGGQILVVPPNTPHKFVNSGAGQLRQVSIHVNGEMIQQDLE